MGWAPVTHASVARPLGSIVPLLYPLRWDLAHPGSPLLALATLRHHRAGLSQAPFTNRNLHLGFSFTASQLDQRDKKCAPCPIGLGSLRVWVLFVSFFVFWSLGELSRYREEGQMQPRDDENGKIC